MVKRRFEPPHDVIAPLVVSAGVDLVPYVGLHHALSSRFLDRKEAYPADAYDVTPSERGHLSTPIKGPYCTLPDSFSIEPYLDRQGQPSLPIARGLVSWVRKVGVHGRIDFNGAEYFVGRRLENQYVVATLSTHHRKVFVRPVPLHAKDRQAPLLSAKQVAMLLRLLSRSYAGICYC